MNVENLANSLNNKLHMDAESNFSNPCHMQDEISLLKNEIGNLQQNIEILKIAYIDRDNDALASAEERYTLQEENENLKSTVYAYEKTILTLQAENQFLEGRSIEMYEENMSTVIALEEEKMNMVSTMRKLEMELNFERGEKLFYQELLNELSKCNSN